MSLEQTKMHYRLFGLRASAVFIAHRLLGVPEFLEVTCPGISPKVSLRLGTSDILAYEQVLAEREYDFDLPGSPRTIVDAGANIGLTSIFFANKFPDAKIVAVEPEASNFAVLTRNVAPYPNVIPICAALWNRDCGMGILSWGEGDHWGYRVTEGSTECRGMTVRTLMKETGIDSIDLFKADIEGAEKEVFSEPGWVKGIPVVIIELHDHIKPGCREAVEIPLANYHRSIRGELTMYSL